MSIESGAFSGCSSLKEIFYTGTRESWKNIQVGHGNYKLRSARVFFYSETQPTDEGNYWHYVDGEPTVWVK